MTSEQMMVLFTLLSFGGLGLGAVVLGAMAFVMGGNRVMAIALALAEIVMGLFIYYSLDQLGWVCVALGAIALVLSLLPRRRRAKSED